MTDYSFGDFTFPPGVAISDNFGNIVPRTQRLPGLSGGYDGYGSGMAPAEIGNVTISFPLYFEWARTTYSESNVADAMKEARDAIREMVTYGVAKLVKPVGSTGSRWCWARTNNIPMTENEDNHTRLLQRFTCNFQVADPRWFSIGTETSTLWGAFTWGGGTWGATVPTPQAVSGTSTSWTITPAGNAETEPRIIVDVGVGGANDIRVQRLVNGLVVDEVSYGGALSNGDQLEINCRTHSVRLNAADAYDANFDFETPDWFLLMPGINNIRVQMGDASNAADVTFRYYEAYR
jgi:hypothetical protein